MARVNTRKAFAAWREGKFCRPCKSRAIWTDGTRLISYGTEIARMHGDHIAFNAQKYSVTTSCQQHGLLVLMDNIKLTVRQFDDAAKYMAHVNG